MLSRAYLRTGLVFGLVAASCVSLADAQDKRGRKYKSPPETSHIEVLVLKDANQKPVANAAVVFHSSKDGRDEGNLEVKTDQEGRAVIDVIPTGSSVDVQVIADGFATFAQNYLVSESSREIQVRMIRPRAQISAYVDTHGQAAQRPMGVQEPNKPGSTQPVTQNPQPTNHTSDPSALAPGAVNDTPKRPADPQMATPRVQTNPPNLHPDSQYPVDPATPNRTPSQTPPPSTPPQL